MWCFTASSCLSPAWLGLRSGPCVEEEEEGRYTGLGRQATPYRLHVTMLHKWCSPVWTVSEAWRHTCVLVEAVNASVVQQWVGTCRAVRIWCLYACSADHCDVHAPWLTVLWSQSCQTDGHMQDYLWSGETFNYFGQAESEQKTSAEVEKKHSSFFFC